MQRPSHGTIALGRGRAAHLCLVRRVRESSRQDREQEQNRARKHDAFSPFLWCPKATGYTLRYSPAGRGSFRWYQSRPAAIRCQIWSWMYARYLRNAPRSVHSGIAYRSTRKSAHPWGGSSTCITAALGMVRRFQTSWTACALPAREDGHASSLCSGDSCKLKTAT